MSRHIMAFFATLCFMVMILAAGFGVCVIPKTTELLAQHTDAQVNSPFTSEEIVRCAVATEDYTMFSNDYSKVMAVVQAINVEAGTPYANLSVEELAKAPVQYTLDADAISHLDDCFEVVNAARAIVIAIAVIGVVLAIILLTKGRDGRRSLGNALHWASVVLLLAIIAAGIYAVVDFNAFFAAFHSLFFADGTWTFPGDSLLITMYPEQFWVGMGIIWLVTSIIVGILFFAIGSAIHPRKAE